MRTVKGQTEVLAKGIFSHVAFTEMPEKAVCLSESRQGCQIRDVICAQRYSTAFLDGASVKKTIIKELIRTIIFFCINMQVSTFN